jgi:hypothetical protein
MAKGKPGCENCPLRAGYDRNPRSLRGRFWRWHIRWCPGWRAYLAGLDAQARAEVAAKYSISPR